MARSATACTVPAATQNHLRTGRDRIHAETASCGTSEPPRRSGSSQPVIATGAPTVSSSQASTRPGLASCSASLVQAPLAALMVNDRGASRQASSEIASHARSSASSSVTHL